MIDNQVAIEFFEQVVLAFEDVLRRVLVPLEHVLGCHDK